jgi:hypothetical protein
MGLYQASFIPALILMVSAASTSTLTQNTRRIINNRFVEIFLIIFIPLNLTAKGCTSPVRILVMTILFMYLIGESIVAIWVFAEARRAALHTSPVTGDRDTYSL